MKIIEFNTQKYLEINPYHPVVKELLDTIMMASGELDSDTVYVMDMVFNTTLVNSEIQIKDPREFSRDIKQILKGEDRVNATVEFEKYKIEYEDNSNEAIEDSNDYNGRK